VVGDAGGGSSGSSAGGVVVFVLEKGQGVRARSSTDRGGIPFSKV